MKFWLALFSICFFTNAFAQEEHLSSFSSVTLTVKFHPKFFLFAEGQLRGIEDFSYPDYYEIKGGLGYNLAKNHKPFIGLGRYGNYKDHHFSKEEFRIWLQDVIDFNLDRVKFENRFRAEKSWFYEPSQDLHTDRVRLRYRLNISAPLNKAVVKPGTISANIYDEFFIIPADEPVFARNRIFGGFSYQVAKTISLSSGYLLQREFGKSANRNLHFIYLGLNFAIDASDADNIFEPHND